MISAARVESLTTLEAAWRASSISGLIARKPAQAGIGVGDRCGNGLIYLVSQRGGQFAHGGYPVHVREVRLRLAQLFFSALAVRHIRVRTNDFNKLSASAQHGMPQAVDVSNCSIRQHDSELDGVVTFSRAALWTHSTPLARSSGWILCSAFRGLAGPAADRSPKFGNFPLTNRGRWSR